MKINNLHIHVIYTFALKTNSLKHIITISVINTYTGTKWQVDTALSGHKLINWQYKPVVWFGKQYIYHKH